MTEIRNTTADMQAPDSVDRLLLLATGMATGNPTEFIEAQERTAQRQLVTSSQLPTEIQHPGTEADFEAAGFTFGPATDGDDLFRSATLPAGWVKRGSDHAMWSYIDDDLGRERVAIFFKGSFYDRRAFMRLVDVHGYVWSCKNNEKPIVTDDEWATPAAVAEAARGLAADARERVASWTEIRGREDQRPDTVTKADEYIAEYTAGAGQYDALAERYADA